MRKQVSSVIGRASRRRVYARALRIEQLEARTLMNVDWRNPVDNIDVNHDLSISPLDVLVIINDINAHSARHLPLYHIPAEPFLDVNGNQGVDPLDVLDVIDYINSAGSGARTLTEQSQFDSQQEISITLGQQALSLPTFPASC